jgi:hypothetical protein
MNEAGMWNDAPCSGRNGNGHLCGIPADGECLPTKFTFNPQRMTQQKAEDTCIAQGGHLASAHSASDQATFRTIADNHRAMPPVVRYLFEGNLNSAFGANHGNPHLHCPVVDPYPDVPGAYQSLRDWQPVQRSPAEIQAAGVELEDQLWEIPQASIRLDANFDDWDCLPYKAQTPFRPCNANGDGQVCTTPVGDATSTDFVEFQAHAGGGHNGITDQASAYAFAWEPEALWAAIKVFDDTHENAGTGWNGDSVQIAFTTNPPGSKTIGDDRVGVDDASMLLYNYGLHSQTGEQILHHQTHPCATDQDCTDAAMERFESIKMTAYEIVFPAASLGIDKLTSNLQFGIGIGVNDGDIISQDENGAWEDRGQKGWSGWGPYSIMFGKQAENTARAVLRKATKVNSNTDWAEPTTYDHGIPHPGEPFRSSLVCTLEYSCG